MILNVLIVIGLGAVAEWFLPWWSIVVVAFLVGAWRCDSFRDAGVVGFTGVSILWIAVASFIHFSSHGILTDGIARMFQMPAAWMVLLLTALLGGAVGSLASLTGFLFQQLRFDGNRD